MDSFCFFKLNLAFFNLLKTFDFVKIANGHP